MQLNQLASSSTTTLNLKHPMTEEETGVVISGYTPDSKEWKKFEKEVLDPNKKQSLIIEKGKQRLELDSDGVEKRRKLLVLVITNIEGIDDWKFSEQSVEDLLINSENHQWMLEQWGEHLDDRKNFFGSSARTASSGQESSGGSTPETTETKSSSQD